MERSRFKKLVKSANKLADEIEKYLIGKNNKTDLTLRLNEYRMTQVEQTELLKIIDEEFKIKIRQ